MLFNSQLNLVVHVHGVKDIRLHNHNYQSTTGLQNDLPNASPFFLKLHRRVQVTNDFQCFVRESVALHLAVGLYTELYIAVL